MSAEKKQQQNDKFLANIIFFLEETVDVVKTIYEENPGIKDKLKLTIDSDIILQKIDEVKSLQDLGVGEFMIQVFITESFSHWDKVKSRDIVFLRTNLETLIPHNFIREIQYFLGNNPTAKVYADEDSIDQLWDYLTAMIHNSVKYAYYSSDKSFVPAGCNLNKIIKEWNVKI